MQEALQPLQTSLSPVDAPGGGLKALECVGALADTGAAFAGRKKCRRFTGERQSGLIRWRCMSCVGLFNGKSKGVCRWIDVKADDAVQAVHSLGRLVWGIASDPVGLYATCPPNALDGTDGYADGCGHFGC